MVSSLDRSLFLFSYFRVVIRFPRSGATLNSLYGACLSRIEVRMSWNCSVNFDRVEDGLEYKDDARISFEKSLILIEENLRIVLTVLEGRELMETGSLQRNARWSERPGSVRTQSDTIEELFVISKSKTCPEE